MVLRSIGNFFGLKESELRDQSTTGLILTLAMVPLKLIWGFLVFMVFAWTTSRSGRSFFLAIPAMIFAVMCIAMVWLSNHYYLKPFGLAAARYRKTSDSASDNYSPKAALLFAKKMVETDPNNEQEALMDSAESKYQLGLSYDRMEKYDEALNVMRWIAPDVEVDEFNTDDGYTMAYYWLANYFANPNKSDVPEDDRKPLSKKNMELAYKASSQNIFAILALAGMNREDASELKTEAEDLRNSGNTDEANEKDALAEEKLDLAVDFLDQSIRLIENPEVGLVSPGQLYASNVLIDILQERGEDREAELKGLQFIGRYEALAERNPNELNLWISIVKVCIQIGDFERGEAYIQRGFQLAQDISKRVTLFKLAAQIDVEKAKTYEDMDDQTQFLERLIALSQAIKTDFNVPEAYNEVLYFVDGFDMEDDKDYWLRDAILGTSDIKDDDKSGVPGVIHILLGMREMLYGDSANGKKHWEISSRQFTYAPYAINKLIQTYVDDREADAETRNKLLGLAIELYPQQPVFYASRGRYFRDDGKYKEAIDDLKFANQRISDNTTILENLVFCYTELGDTEKADELQEQIDQIESRQETSMIDIFSSSEPIDAPTAANDDNDE